MTLAFYKVKFKLSRTLASEYDGWSALGDLDKP